ncbi:MAG: hypothetical protein ABSF81_14815 [Bacteroidales bacterium]
MPLTKELKIQSFVLLSKKPSVFNPANFSQYWLDHNKIILGSTLDKSSSFTPLFVQAISDNMVLLVTPEQIQISPKSPEKFKNIVSEGIVSMIQNMEIITLNGVGLNFNWFLSDEEVGYEELSRKYFFNANNPGIAFFPKGESLYGEYLSKQIEDDLRLKLDIKPSYLFDIVTGTSKQCIHFAFNFHSDLKSENQYEKVVNLLKRFETWYEVSLKVLNLYQ